MISKGVILCGGWATRFMPVTLGIPKEMLPLFSTPIIHLLAEDLVNNGVTEIIFVIRKGKECIKSYFKPEKKLTKQLNPQTLGIFDKFKNIKFRFVYQKRQLGTGNALLCAKKYLNTPFYLLNGDEVLNNPTSLITQLKQAYKTCNSSVMALSKVQKTECHKYGMLTFEGNGELVKLKQIYEKPEFFEAKEYLSNMGAYVFLPNIFNYIKASKTDQTPLTDAINEYLKHFDMFGLKVKGTRFDLGTPLSYALSNICYLYSNPATKNKVKEYLTYLQQK